MCRRCYLARSLFLHFRCWICLLQGLSVAQKPSLHLFDCQTKYIVNRNVIVFRDFLESGPEYSGVIIIIVQDNEYGGIRQIL